MKILAIRGQNLASLARSFAIELGSGPLRDVGLFAITGPVGAGKSTLLDALCLALFDRTPRLSNRGGVLVGDDAAAREDWLRSNDPRTLLRRDATEGHAEVDFTGRDGAKYRAKWSVRRARRRRDGRVQDAEMSLEDLDRKVVVASGRKTEVLAAIEVRLGLDFAQFCRSVLLAQGEFAAFLRASADERARLLENLTGADIYRKLSRGAHERRKAIEGRVSVLRAQLAAHELLDAPTRAALEAEKAQLAADAKACTLGVELASGYVNWHMTAAQRASEEGEALVHLNEAIVANDAAAGRRAHHRRMEKALGLVAHQAQVERHQRDQTIGEVACSASRAAVAAAGAAVDEAARRLAVAASALFSGAALPRIVRELPRWESALQERANTGARRASLTTQLPRLVAAEQAAAAALANAREASARVENVRVQADARAETARAASAVPEVADVSQQRRRLDVAREQLQRCRALADADAALAVLRVGIAELEAEREAAAAALVTANDALARRRTEAGLVALRHTLVAGQPCPLCGAAEHHVEAVHGDDALAPAEQAAKAAQALAERTQRAVMAREAAIAQAEHALASARQAATKAPAAAALSRPELAQHESRLEEQARDLEQREVQAAAAMRELGAAVQAAGVANKATADAQRAERTAAAEHARLAAALACAHAGIGQLDTTLAAQDPLLATAFAGVDGWSELLQRDDALTKLQQVHRLDAALVAAEHERTKVLARHAELTLAAERTVAEVASATAALAQAAAAAGLVVHDVAEAASMGADGIEAEGRWLAALVGQVEQRRAVLRERTDQRKKHEASGRPEMDAADARQALEDARRAHEAVQKRQVEVQARLKADDSVRKQRDEIAPRLQAADEQLAVWAALDDLIGSSTGDAFVVYAQGLTLDLLLIEANRRLMELARRYRLEKNPTGEMDFVVVDLDLGGTRRGLQSLSGGESFLVSLSLALALATLAAPRARVETLLLDEGFGTLDAQHLEAALGALDTLQASGCQVGVISHVDGIAERIGAVVEVRPEGGGQSRVLARVR